MDEIDRMTRAVIPQDIVDDQLLKDMRECTYLVAYMLLNGYDVKGILIGKE